MKLFAFLLVLSTSIAAQAASELACWDIYSPRGSRPILKATIGENNELDVQLNFKDKYFEGYKYDTKNCGAGGCSHSVGVLISNEGPIAAKLIETNRSPYKGNNEYKFVFATNTYDFQPAEDNTESEPKNRLDELQARLILPTDLSNEFLRSYRIRKDRQRSNAVVIIKPPVNSSQSGDSYLRMFCKSSR